LLSWEDDWGFLFLGVDVFALWPPIILGCLVYRRLFSIAEASKFKKKIGWGKGGDGG